MAGPSAGSSTAAEELPGPFGVGRYARKLQVEMRARAHVQLIGEVTGISRSRKQLYFELRDAEGAVPCAMWSHVFKRAALPDGALRDGAAVVVAGGPDYYPGGGQASPSFSFRATHLRLAGEGDLLARLEALRKALEDEGLFELQKRLPRPLLPKGIGVVTAEGGAARRDLLAALGRRGWGGSIVWAFAPVQDRQAAPAIAGAIQALAARPDVEAIVVTRGGGSLADLWAFCDEALCRSVALLRVPVISAIGHERDRTLLDDVAAVSCSTPTHAAEAAVPLDCAVARAQMSRTATVLQRASESAVAGRARHLAALARGPARALQRERGELNQKTREIRAASERGISQRALFQRRSGALLSRRAIQGTARVEVAGQRAARHQLALHRAASSALTARRGALGKALVALRAHDPERILERGYALVEDRLGEPVSGVASARAARRVTLRFADGRIGASIEDESEREAP